MTYKHKEAYCLMKYRELGSSHVEILWNARDGVTPFDIPMPNGRGRMQHFDFPADVCVPDHQPKHGSRIFVYLSRAELVVVYERQLKERWDNGIDPEIRAMFDSPEAGAKSLAASAWNDGQAPGIAVVGTVRRGPFHGGSAWHVGYASGSDISVAHGKFATHDEALLEYWRLVPDERPARAS